MKCYVILCTTLTKSTSITIDDWLTLFLQIKLLSVQPIVHDKQSCLQLEEISLAHLYSNPMHHESSIFSSLDLTFLEHIKSITSNRWKFWKFAFQKIVKLLTKNDNFLISFVLEEDNVQIDFQDLNQVTIFLQNVNLLQSLQNDDILFFKLSKYVEIMLQNWKNFHVDTKKGKIHSIFRPVLTLFYQICNQNSSVFDKFFHINFPLCIDIAIMTWSSIWIKKMKRYISECSRNIPRTAKDRQTMDQFNQFKDEVVMMLTSVLDDDDELYGGQTTVPYANQEDFLIIALILKLDMTFVRRFLLHEPFIKNEKRELLKPDVIYNILLSNDEIDTEKNETNNPSYDSVDMLLNIMNMLISWISECYIHHRANMVELMTIVIKRYHLHRSLLSDEIKNTGIVSSSHNIKQSDTLMDVEIQSGDNTNPDQSIQSLLRSSYCLAEFFLYHNCSAESISSFMNLRGESFTTLIEA
jgi:hypothetical protein